MKNKTELISIVLFISALIMLVSCQKQKAEWKGTIEEVDGVTIVMNPKEPYKIKGEPTSLVLEEEFIIDFEREDFAKLGLTDLWGFEIDSEGNIYILHFRSKENIVFKFDRNGEYICSFGKKGLGPDEIQYASFSRIHLWPRINAEDRIVITDSRGKKLLIFDKDGSLLKNIKLELNFEAAVPINAETYLVLNFSDRTFSNSKTFGPCVSQSLFRTSTTASISSCSIVCLPYE